MQGKSETPDVIARAISRYRAGVLTRAEIAAEAGVTVETVKNWVRRSGIPRKSPGRPKLTR